MAENTITGLVPDIYEALDVVSRELTGMIPAVTMSASAETASLNQDIIIDVEPEGTSVDITPAMVVPDPAGQTSGTQTLTITKSKASPFGFNGEAQKGLQTGPGYMSVRANKVAQSIRVITNLVEIDLAALQATFSRAYGTAGTTPFATANDYTDATLTNKILKDNGAPDNVAQMVLNTTAGATFKGKQSAVNSAGTDSMLRQGVLLDIDGMPIRESAQINTSVAGDMSGGKTNNAGYAIGATAFGLQNATGTGTVSAGDIITFAGDTNKYVITSATFAGANPATGDLVTIAEPGLRVAIAAANVAITVIAAAARNMVFSRSAIVLAARAPARPEEGDLATDVSIITDPRSGLSLEFAMYKGYRKVRYEVALAWGQKNVKPEHTAILLG